MVVLIASVALAWAGVWYSQALADDFSLTGDEPSHFVTSMMMRDFLRQGLDAHPMRFAENYYVHYPKIGIGHWPPLFYAALGGWMALFGSSRLAALMFLAFNTGLVSVLLWTTLRKRVGRGPAWFAALSFPLIPLVRGASSSVMTEIPGALLLLVTLIALANFLENGKRRWAAGFALAAILAIMTRPTGWQLAITAPLGALLAGRWRDLFRKPLLIAGGAVAATCLPFYLRFLPTIKDGTALDIGWLGYLQQSIPTFGWQVLASLTPWPTILFLVGLGMTIPRARRAGDPYWAVMMSGWIVGLFFPVLIPASLEERHLMPVVAPGLALAAAGLAALCRHWDLRPVWGTALSILAVLAASIGLTVPHPARETFRKTVAGVLSDRDSNEARVFLVSSTHNGEGRFIAEMAAQSGCCRNVVLRASQQMADSNWDLSSYKLRYQTAEALGRSLEGKVNLLVIHEMGGPIRRDAHHRLLERMIQESPEVWEKTATIEAPADALGPRETVSLYRNRKPLRNPRDFEIDLSSKLGRVLRLQLD